MTKSMTSAFLSAAWATLLITLLACHNQTASVEEHPKAVTAVTTDSIAVIQTVLTFLNWYKSHIRTANQIQLVNQQAGKPYSVNFKNGERYLAYLRSSNLLTNAYLNEWRTYFTERDAGFRLSRQDEGPPTGFDYDLVMLTQDVDKQLASLESLKMDEVTTVKDRATVALTLLDDYEFRLVRQNNRWLINEILNASQE